MLKIINLNKLGDYALINEYSQLCAFKVSGENADIHIRSLPNKTDKETRTDVHQYFHIIESFLKSSGVKNVRLHTYFECFDGKRKISGVDSCKEYGYSFHSMFGNNGAIVTKTI